MRHGDLLAAISDLEPVEVSGDFERHCGLRWKDLAPSAAGGRWGARAGPSRCSPSAGLARHSLIGQEPGAQSESDRSSTARS